MGGYSFILINQRATSRSWLPGQSRAPAGWSGTQNTEKFHQACQDRGIDVILLIPHGSDQIHPFHHITFALLKQRDSASIPDMACQVVQILWASFAASAPPS
jgi:hypothetical protein